MKTHPLDVASLVFGLVLVAATTVLAVREWTDLSLDGQVFWPLAMIGLGVLILALTMRGRTGQAMAAEGRNETLVAAGDDPAQRRGPNW